MIKVLNKDMNISYKKKMYSKSKTKDELYYKAAFAIFGYTKIESKTLVIISDNDESFFSLAYAKCLKSKKVDVSILQLKPINNNELISFLSTCIDIDRLLS